MRLLRKGKESVPTAESSAAQEEVLAEVQDVDPSFAFVDGHSKAIDRSSETWQDIAVECTAFYNTPEELENIKQRVVYLQRQANTISTSEDLELISQKLADQLSVYTLMFARTLSGLELGIGDRGAEAVRIMNASPENVQRMLGGNRIRSTKAVYRITSAAQRMREADALEENVLADLTELYKTRPEGLEDLADLYDNDVASYNPRFAELRRMIAHDWHQASPQNSRLHGFLNQLVSEPTVFIEGFSRDVEAATVDPRKKQVKRFVRFAALAVAAVDEQANRTIGDVLRSTYDEWDEYEEIKTAFRFYVKQKEADIRAALEAIAGPRRRDNIRTNRSESELDEYLSTLSFGADTLIVPDPMQSPSKKRPRRGGGERRRQIPTSADIGAAVLSGEVERPPLEIKLAKKTAARRYVAVPATAQEVVDSFSIKNVGGLRSDLEKMVQHLQQEPVSSGTRKLPSSRAGSSFIIDGKAASLWHFAPNAAQKLDIAGETKQRYRVVYAWRDQELIIFDVIHHNDFDQKYAMG